MSCHSHTDTNADADTNADTNADADTDADTYANTYTYGSVIARHCARKRRPFIGFRTAQYCRALRSAQPVFYGGP